MSEFDLGESYRGFKSRGMDHGDAAYRADQAERRAEAGARSEEREAIRKLRHFAACVAAGTWHGQEQRMAREVLEMTKEFETRPHVLKLDASNTQCRACGLNHGACMC